MSRNGGLSDPLFDERKKEEEAYSEIKDGMDENETDDEDGRKLRTAFS